MSITHRMTMAVFSLVGGSLCLTQAWAARPAESRPKNAYVLSAVPFDVPPRSVVTVYITEEDSMDAVGARVYPVMLAGATVNVIPVMEYTPGGATKTEKKLRG